MKNIFKKIKYKKKIEFEHFLFYFFFPFAFHLYFISLMFPSDISGTRHSLNKHTIKILLLIEALFWLIWKGFSYAMNLILAPVLFSIKCEFGFNFIRIKIKKRKQSHLSLNYSYFFSSTTSY